MQKDFSTYERFLRFEKLDNTVTLMRARSVYIIGWAFIFTQMINIFLMTMTYGGWIVDHWISLFAMISIFSLIHTLRFTHNFTYFALGYSFLLLSGLFVAAIQVNTGINTAILPLLVAGCLLNGFIGGARLVWLYAAASIAMVWGLYFISASAPPLDMADHATYSARIFQRAVQTSLALFLVSAFSAFISGAMNELFETLEARIAVLEADNEQKIKFLDTLTHELQTPILGVMSMSDQMSSGTLDNEQTKRLGIVRKCAKRLVRLARLRTH